MLEHLKEEADEVYSVEDLCGKLGFDPNRPRADWYFHHKTCKWVVQEDKERDKIWEGIRQLENTVEQLRRAGKPVDKIQLKIKSIGRESRIYGRDIQGHLVRKLGREKAKKVLIMSMPVFIVYY